MLPDDACDVGPALADDFHGADKSPVLVQGPVRAVVQGGVNMVYPPLAAVMMA